MSFSTHGTNGNAEDAVIAQVTFERDKNGKVLVTKGEYIKTYAWKDKTGSRLIHRIIPVSAAVTTPVAFGMKSQLTNFFWISTICGNMERTLIMGRSRFFI